MENPINVFVYDNYEIMEFFINEKKVYLKRLTLLVPGKGNKPIPQSVVFPVEPEGLEVIWDAQGPQNYNLKYVIHNEELLKQVEEELDAVKAANDPRIIKPNNDDIRKIILEREHD